MSQCPVTYRSTYTKMLAWVNLPLGRMRWELWSGPQPSRIFNQAVKISLRTRSTLTAHKPVNKFFTVQSSGMLLSSSFHRLHLWSFLFISREVQGATEGQACSHPYFLSDFAIESINAPPGLVSTELSVSSTTLLHLLFTLLPRLSLASLMADVCWTPTKCLALHQVLGIKRDKRKCMTPVWMQCIVKWRKGIKQPSKEINT